jgi:NarL family two-component system response regulator LiaR
VRVALVNDYPLVVAGLAALLAPHADRIEVVELDSRVPVARNVDVILHDAFAYTDGLADYLRSSARVIVYTFVEAPDAISMVLSAGAAGYVFKGISTRELVVAIERVHAGEQVVQLGDESSRAGTEGAQPEEGDGHGTWPGREAGLTVRESEVLALICRGLSNQEIADRVYLSINSVKTYIRTAYRKINVSTRSQAVLWGVRNGFTPQQERVPPGH